MTLAVLQTLLTVAATRQDGLTYSEIARTTGLEYDPVVYQVAQLSEGRGGQPGLGLLLVRTQATSGNRLVGLTEAGWDLGRTFVDGARRQASLCQISSVLRDGPLPAVQIVCEAMPGISLGSFTVLLYVARLQKAFGYEGLASNSLAQELAISNLSRHLAILGDGLGQRSGYGVIRLVQRGSDKRIKLPELTDHGHQLVSSLAATVIGEDVIPPVRPRPVKLYDLRSPEDVRFLNADDFEALPVRSRPTRLQGRV